MLNLKSILSSLSLGLAATVASAADYTLVVPLSTGTDNPNYRAVEAFKFHVETRSKGAIEVQIFPGGTLCSSGRECFEGMQAGVVDITQSNLGEPSNLWPAFAGLDLPYMLRDDEVAECVFDDESFMADLRRGFLDATGNVRLMVISNSGGWRNFATTDEPILTPEDVKGRKLRTIPAEIQQELVRQLGGAPTAVNWPEVYTSLATGVVEGTKNGIADIVVMNFQDHLKHITLDGHAYMGGTWFVNNDKLQSMPQELQIAVAEGFDVIEQNLRTWPKYQQIASYDAFVAAGGQIHSLSNDEKAAFKAATSGMEDWYVAQGEGNQAFLDRFKTAIAACEASVDARLSSMVD